MRATLVLLALLMLAPTAAACDGLSPGDNLVSDGASCTLAFLVADPTGLYFTTAGHCIAEDAAATNPEYGTFGTGAFTFLAGQSANGEGSPGNDFALIRIDPAVYGDLNPKMCGWDGPTGVFRDTATSGDVRHYGFGMIFGEMEPTRAREGTNLQYDGADVFRWLGAGMPGDSGSAVIHADGRALGVLTHLGTGAGTTNSGTHLDRGFALAAEAGYDLRLVLAGEDPLAVLREVQAAAGVEPTVPPADETPPEGSPDASGGDGNATEEPADGNATEPAGGGNAGEPADDATDDPLDPAGTAPAATDSAAAEAATPGPAPLLAMTLAAALAVLRSRRRA